VTWGLFLHQGGTIELLKPIRSPVSLVDPAVVHPRGLDLDGPGGGGDRPGPGVAVLPHQAVPVFVELFDELLHVGVRLGFEGHGQHALGAPAADLIERRREFLTRGLVSYYSQHRRLLPCRCINTGGSFAIQGRYAALTGKWVIHKFWL
jgi:hypothetical protein